jgi:hypothetical protein
MAVRASCRGSYQPTIGHIAGFLLSVMLSAPLEDSSDQKHAAINRLGLSG